MQRVLSLEQTPGFSVPLRFFLTAPLFAIAAGTVLLWHGPQALASRWSPLALALTHLLTLGFLSMSMVGALLQLLPVVAGVHLPRLRLTAGVVHLSLLAGTLALSAAFWSAQPVLFKIAIVALPLAFGWLLAACAIGLRRALDRSATLGAISLSLAGAAVAVGLGVAAASGFAWPLALPLIELTRLHAAWGLLGWVGLLVVGVAYQVVPMFQVTELYPLGITRRLARALFLLLCLWSGASALLPANSLWLSGIPATLLGAGYALFAVSTLLLIWRRKRPKPDAATLFWYTSLLSLLAGIGLWAAGAMLPELAAAPTYPFALGILGIVGFGYSAVNGMLYKIVPFLVWYHLQNHLAASREKAPGVKQIVTEQVAKRQYYAHLAALLLLLGATVWPQQLAHLAGAGFVVSSGWLWLNLLLALRLYRRRLRQHAVRAAATAVAG